MEELLTEPMLLLIRPFFQNIFSVQFNLGEKHNKISQLSQTVGLTKFFQSELVYLLKEFKDHKS